MSCSDRFARLSSLVPMTASIPLTANAHGSATRSAAGRAIHLSSIDTRLFAPHRSPYCIGLASGAHKHVVERHTLNDDGRGLTLEVFLEDPEYLSDGFSGTLNWDYTPDFENCRYDCDPEVATRFTLP